MEERDTSRKQYDMDTVATPMDEWNRLPWKAMQRQVFRLAIRGSSKPRNVARPRQSTSSSDS